MTPLSAPPASANERELELVRRIAARDRQALKDLYVLYHRRLGRFLMRMTSRHDVCEEVINDTILTVWNSAATFRGESRVSTWIVGIAYRRALKSLRHQNRNLRSLDYEELVTPDASTSTDDREWIESALRQLPYEQRMALELAYVMGHSCEEIGKIMHCSVNTAKTRLFHARRKLRTLLPRLGGMEDAS